MDGWMNGWIIHAVERPLIRLCSTWWAIGHPDRLLATFKNQLKINFVM
jgi:hypothetical protein